MSNDAQGVTDSGAAPRGQAPGEAAVGPPAAAVPAPSSDFYSHQQCRVGNSNGREKPSGDSGAGHARASQGKRLGLDQPIWDYVSVYVKEVYRCFSIFLL